MHRNMCGKQTFDLELCVWNRSLFACLEPEKKRLILGNSIVIFDITTGRILLSLLWIEGWTLFFL